MAAVALSATPAMLFIAQAASGAVIALIAPALVVFIAANFHGQQQAKAIGYLAAAIPAAGVLALLIAGTFASTIGWRYSFALIVVLAVINLLLSFRLKPVAPQKDVKIDWTGALIAAASVILLSFGFSGLNTWGVVLATEACAVQHPRNLTGTDPDRSRHHRRPDLLHLAAPPQGSGQAADLRPRRAAHRLGEGHHVCMAAMLFVGTAANFLIPLYIQIVQGRSSFQTSIAIIPYTLSIFVASTIVATLYKRFPPRQIARVGFVVVALGAHPARLHHSQRVGAGLRHPRPDHPRPRPGRDRRPGLQHPALGRAQDARR